MIRYDRGYVHVSVCACVDVCMCGCVHVWVCACVDVCMCQCVHVWVCACVCGGVLAFILACVR